MISAVELDPHLLALGKAIGLLDGSGNIDVQWFEDPAEKLKSILTDADQRAGLLELLGAQFSPVSLPGLPPGEQWHPLLGPQPRGNVYLTVNSKDGLVLGVGGELDGTAAPLSSLRFSVPLVQVQGSSMNFVAGTAQGPLRLRLRVGLGWKQPVQSIGLDAVSVTISLAPQPAAKVLLEQLDLGGGDPRDTELDPAKLGPDAVRLILGLIRQNLKQVTTGDVALAVRDHLLGLLGFSEDGVPPFPLDASSALVQAWFRSLAPASGVPPLQAWLQHLAGLAGSGPVAVAGSGLPDNPWLVPLFSFGGDSQLDLIAAVTEAAGTRSLLLGVRVNAVPGGGSPALRVEGEGWLAAIALTGDSPAVVLPSAALAVRAPGSASAPRVVDTSQIKVRSLRAGVVWAVSQLRPVIELLDVDFGGKHYDRIDLTDADSVVALASATVLPLILSALGAGAGAGRPLAALAGLVPPSRDPGSPLAVDPGLFVSQPTRAIGAFHRSVLLDATHNWSSLLGEVADLLGTGGAITGSGTVEDPWRSPLGPAAPLAVELAAWNAGTGPDPQRLRLGLRAASTLPPFQFSWLAELLAFDLPDSAAGAVSLMAGHHMVFRMQPVFSTEVLPKRVLAAESLDLRMDWAPGRPVTWLGSVKNLSLTGAGGTILVPQIPFPATAGFDVQNPAGTAAILGVGVAQLESLLKDLLSSSARQWGGVPGYVIAGLCGVHGLLAGLPEDWPTLTDPGTPGSLFSDPIEALRSHFVEVCTGSSGDGTPFLLPAVRWLAALLGDSLPPQPDSPVSGFATLVEGSGRYEDPWSFAVGDQDGLEAVIWMEPAGPPAAWSTGLAKEISSAESWRALLAQARDLALVVPRLRDALDGRSLGSLADSLAFLEDHFINSDGIVPASAQIPTGANWTAGTPIRVPHGAQPQDPDAINQILAQIDTWAGGAGAARSVVLLASSFSDHDAWSALLASPNRHGTTDPAARFSLRLPGVDPLTIDLTAVGAIADYYTADLADDGSGNLGSLAAQIDRVVSRIQQLKPGVPVTLVAHSDAGLAARQFTATSPSRVQGLITLGTPHFGAPLGFLLDPDAADAVRFLALLRDDLPGIGSFPDALREMIRAQDGFRPPSKDGDLPIPAPFPLSMFSLGGVIDTGGRPALALGGGLGVDLLAEARGALAGQAARDAADTRPAPTHLAFGLRLPVGVAAAAAFLYMVESSLRVGVSRVALQNAAPEPARAKNVVTVDVELSRRNGWLLGAPSSLQATPSAVHVRRMRLGLDFEPAGAQMTAHPRGSFLQPAFHGPMVVSAGLKDSLALPVLGAVFHDIAAANPSANTAIGELLSSLQALDLVVVDPHGGLGFSADAFAALTTEGAAVPFLGPRLWKALARPEGFAGFQADPSGTWTLSLGGLPVEASIGSAPAHLDVRTREGSDLELGPLHAGFRGSVAFPDLSGTLDLTVGLGDVALSRSQTLKTLVLESPGWFPQLSLSPKPTLPALSAVLDDFLPRLLFSSVASAFLQAVVSPTLKIGPLDEVFRNTKRFLSGRSALGNGARLDASRINLLLGLIAKAAGFPPGPGMLFPAGIRLAASDGAPGSEATRLQLSTTAPLGGVCSLAVGLSFDKDFNAVPTGSIALKLPKSGTLSETWPAITLTFLLDEKGISLTVAPQGQPAIQLLPTFSGFGALAGGAQALLPAALDAIIGAFPLPLPSLVDRALKVAAAFGIYDAVKKFTGHSDDLRAMSQSGWLSGAIVGAARPTCALAVKQFLDLVPLPGAVTLPAASKVSWSFPLAAPDAGTTSLTFGWDSGGPMLLVSLDGWKRSSGAVTVKLALGYAAGEVQCSTSFSAALKTSLGLPVTPRLSIGYTGASFNVSFFPLAADAVDGPMRLDLAPSLALTKGPDFEASLFQSLLLPLVTSLLFEATKGEQATPVWTGGRTVLDLLDAAGIVDKLAPGTLKSPQPELPAMIFGLLSGLAAGSGLELPIDAAKNLRIAFLADSGKIGVALKGFLEFSIGIGEAGVFFGMEPSSPTGMNRGLLLLLFDGTGSVSPELRVSGLGLGLRGPDGSALIDLGQFRLDAFRGYLAFDSSPGEFGAAMELEGLGLPLGIITGGGVSTDNPVVASLLESSGPSGGGRPGDRQPVNPRINLIAWWTSSGGFQIVFQGETGVVWIAVHQGFGPIYIEQIGIRPIGTTAAELMIDGSVKVMGLTAQTKELGVVIPYHALTSPDQWKLDLAGLAISFNAPGVSIAGAFLKDAGPPIEYSGMLLMKLDEFGFLAVGAYSRPQEGDDTYTSLFIFAAVFVPIGLPPVIEISGLGLGVGYNRQILVPTDMNQIPEFIIVEALDRPEVFAEDPMGELLQIRKSMPPRRGSYWVAVGLRGTSFAVVNVTAILYVALDRGFEIGVLGVGRLSLPDGAPLLNIELALKARFSSAEGVLSIQAQLTDNCWFLFPNCQLTGGFAFYMCFPKSQFLLTIGGYHPNFSKPPEFPIVPRLGFKYSMIIYSIKGESYFALTNSCVMFGTRLELAYGFDWLQAWLTAYADFLISWDPFFYMARVGIEIGVRVRIEVCFIECVHVTLSLSVGASLELAGPPMHGKVTVDLDVVSFTIPFGDEPRPDTKHLLWPQFRLKYLYTDDPAGHAVTVHALEGLLPPEPAGAEPAPGTESQPWRLSSEWSFETTSTMAAQALMTRAGEVIEVEGVYDHLDVAPMGKDHVKSYHLAEFFGRSGSQWSPASSSQIRFQAVVKQLSEAIWLYYGEGKVPAAANTLPLVTGVRIVGSAGAVNPSGLIPIGKLVDVSNSRPLPFAGRELFSMYVQFGAAAESLASQALGLSNRSAASVARDVLSGAGTFADARRSLGLPGEGLPAMAVRSLERRRSAPPLLTPVSTGLTMKPVGLGAPPVIDEVPPGEVAVLERPRLKTIMQTRPPVVADQPPSARTSVASMAADGVPRMSAPRPDFVTGARLLRVPAPDSTRPTAMPSFGRTVRNVEAGSSPAASHVQAFDKAQADFESGGIRIPSGTTYVWDVPLATGRRLLLSGTAAVRVSFLTGNGTLLQDAEIALPREEETTFPANATMVAVSCLGRAPDSGVPLSPSFGAVSAMAAPPGARAATGWQTGNVACQVGGSALLVRGGYLRLPAHALSFHFDQQIGQSAVKLSDVMIDQEGAETWLPASTSVLMVLLDAQEVTAAEEGDLAITVDGARPGSPLRVTGGRRRAVLYDVLERVGQREFLTVAVASRRGFRLAGVVGLPGKAQEWATRLNGEVPAHLVPDGPLTPDGEVVARLAGLDGGHP